MVWRRRSSRARKPATRGASVTRRGLFLIGAQLGVAGLLAWRMRQLQVVEGERYRLLAEENRINMTLLAPARARPVRPDG